MNARRLRSAWQRNDRSRDLQSDSPDLMSRPKRNDAPVEVRGRFLLMASAVTAVERLLPTYRGVDGDHEGMVFLAGRELAGDLTLLTTAIAPDCEHSRGRVWANRSAVGSVASGARKHALAVLAQVHSHPGASTRHSLGDDQMILMPFESMLSIIVPHYGRFGMRPVSTLGVHQFQDGEWRLCDSGSVAGAVTVVPDYIDLR